MKEVDRDDVTKSLAVYGALLLISRLSDESNEREINLVAANLLALFPDTTRSQLDKMAIFELKRLLENE